jgi:NAD(P)-dependent dehydrogenase (short-subunit alcohol dehydrogenase family)
MAENTIGYESVKALYASTTAHTILMGSRSLEKAHVAIAAIWSEVSASKSDIVPLQLDIEDDASIETAFKEVQSKYGKLDALVNNAGTLFPQGPEAYTTQSITHVKAAPTTPPSSPPPTTPQPAAQPGT